jgi:hypothetical protein
MPSDLDLAFVPQIHIHAHDAHAHTHDTHARLQHPYSRPARAPSISTHTRTLDTHAGRLDTHAHTRTLYTHATTQDDSSPPPLPRLKRGSEGSFSPTPISSPGSPSPAQLRIHIRYVIATSKYFTFTDGFCRRCRSHGPCACPSPTTASTLTLTTMLTLTPSTLTPTTLVPTSKTVDDALLTRTQDTYPHNGRLAFNAPRHTHARRLAHPWRAQLRVRRTRTSEGSARARVRGFNMRTLELYNVVRISCCSYT